MTRYLLDTNILGYFVRGTHAELNARMQRALLAQELAISAVTRAETRFGLALMDRQDRRVNTIHMVLDILPVLPWTAEDADHYGEIAAHLKSAGQPIDQMDTMIAAHALSTGLTLVTHNTRHFQRVPGLRLVDWVGPAG